jgi:hypothetical protein
MKLRAHRGVVTEDDVRRPLVRLAPKLASTPCRQRLAVGAYRANAEKGLLPLLLDGDAGDDAGVHDPEAMLGKVDPERGIRKHGPVDRTHRHRHLRVHVPERSRRGAASRVELPFPLPREQFLLVIAADDERSRLTRDVEHAERFRTPRDEITHEDDLIARPEPRRVEQCLELSLATVNVADDEGATHWLSGT